MGQIKFCRTAATLTRGVISVEVAGFYPANFYGMSTNIPLVVPHHCFLWRISSPLLAGQSRCSVALVYPPALVLEDAVGFDPTTCRLTADCYCHLSYTSKICPVLTATGQAVFFDQRKNMNSIKAPVKFERGPLE
jgi:hypothetical protein